MGVSGAALLSIGQSGANRKLRRGASTILVAFGLCAGEPGAGEELEQLAAGGSESSYSLTAESDTIPSRCV
jgi:hypothetical protein